MKKSIAILLALIMTVSVFIGISISAKLAGDTNGDGNTDNKDVVTLFRFVSGNTAGAIAANCDFNGDKETNNKDVVDLFRAVSSGNIPTVPDEETVTETEETTDVVTEETETESETEEQEKKELTFIDFGTATDDCLDMFVKASYCQVDITEDGEEGQVISITTKNIVSSSSKPTVFFSYSGYCMLTDKLPVDFTEKPFVVLKVKVCEANDRMFSLIGSVSDKSVRPANEVTSKIPGGDGWHYVIFDFTDAETPDKFNVFRMGFEQTSAGDGEAILISEMRICTAEEAEEYKEQDVYPYPEQAMEDYKIKVIQFNVQTENGNSAPFAIRSEMYRQLVDELQPDVVGMQEVTVTWRKWLDTYVFNESYASVGEPRTTDASQGLEANPIYYRKDKFDLVESGTFWLSDTPDVVGSMYEDSNYPRICTWAVLRDKQTGFEFVHLNTHLDHNGDHKDTGNDRRKRQIGVIIKFAQRFDNDMPMFLTGDLNNRRTTSEGKTYALIKMIQGKTMYTDANGNQYSIALSDARLKAPGADTVNIATMTKYYDESNSAYNPSNEPIDYIFFNQESLTALSYQTFLISRNGMWISDHLPLYATFTVKPPAD